MLFNSYSFIFLFLPITIIVFFWLGKRNELWAAGWLGIASLIFYGWWSYQYIPLLLLSILFNYLFGRQIAETENRKKKRWFATLGIIVNLGLLAYYKYVAFFESSINAITNLEINITNIVLPIGISFFTFTQIAFLVDTFQGKVKEYRFVHYLLFVTYFPHLIAGPVLHHREMMPQFADSANYRLSPANIAIGVSIFVIGLAKKVLIADNIAPYANYLFDSPESPSLFVAWGGVLAYTFQIYFDFSGYSDMAIGLSRLFGVRLPLNFNSPYKSTNIVEFWRRWHMTLSRFLKDYLYIPLGGNRHGQTRRYANLLTTMLLGGLWHGAGWNFVIWGGLHGIYLIINHAWQKIFKSSRVKSRLWLSNIISTTLTFSAISFAWVFFRSTDVAIAQKIIKGMIGIFGIGIPHAIGTHFGTLKTTLEEMGVTFFLGGGTRFVETWLWVFLAGYIAFMLPNTQQLMRKFEPALDFDSEKNQPKHMKNLIWSPTPGCAFVMSIITLAGLLSLNHPAEFLYFQF